MCIVANEIIYFCVCALPNSVFLFGFTFATKNVLIRTSTSLHSLFIVRTIVIRIYARRHTISEYIFNLVFRPLTITTTWITSLFAHCFRKKDRRSSILDSFLGNRIRIKVNTKGSLKLRHKTSRVECINFHQINLRSRFLLLHFNNENKCS